MRTNMRYIQRLLESARRIKQQRLIQESRAPQDGPYYWVPTPTGEWELLTWFTSDLGIDHSDHTIVWRKYVVPYLAELWGVPERSLINIPYSVPRGRVSKGHKAFYINHGGDAPVNPEELVRQVCREFNLTAIARKYPIKAALDNHERIIPADARKLQTILSQSGIRGGPV